jgi:hypothetical protein
MDWRDVLKDELKGWIGGMYLRDELKGWIGGMY